MASFVQIENNLRNFGKKNETLKAIQLLYVAVQKTIFSSSGSKCSQIEVSLQA